MYSHVVRFCAVASLLAGAAVLPGQAPDNTAVNKRDRQESAATADKASNKAADRELMQQVRKSIVDDDSLSTYAKNVKVIAKNGKITLKGPVRSQEEKASIVAKATEVAGAGNVTDQITIKPDKNNKADRMKHDKDDADRTKQNQ